MTSPDSPPDHKALMAQALTLARSSPCLPTNYRVGALLVDPTPPTTSSSPESPAAPSPKILSTGYTLELPGNTHAEQCCLAKVSSSAGDAQPPSTELPDDGQLQRLDLPRGRLALYTTMEPCVERLSGNLPCVQRILAYRDFISDVYVGVLEPDTFVKGNSGRAVLEASGIRVHHVVGLEDEILAVATAGHARPAAEP
ncbi:hypothetical protein PpBr36_08124 [Pyricularia pennisetigena]|uniref:hypothetical protein n=1 Tax=Pyricularia pennisetigena TaxID=1578925 RepID=UPI00114DB151|nr:hypothetical protein PpBr36_08124 [Pyricularia pennisetigena]TLS24663.1 hypothetical protein PpBr36_08124 [Pyricularia pennisetigena]